MEDGGAGTKLGSLARRCYSGPVMAYICTLCGKMERDCDCTDKYCMICKSQENLRLCADGCYYCADCREACGFLPED